MLNNIERMTITLPRDMAAVVRRAVKDGGYVSSSEVIREALRSWKGQRETGRAVMPRRKKSSAKSLSPQRQALERARKLVGKHVDKNRSLADELIAERRREALNE